RARGATRGDPRLLPRQTQRVPRGVAAGARNGRSRALGARRRTPARASRAAPLRPEAEGSGGRGVLSGLSGPARAARSRLAGPAVAPGAHRFRGLRVGAAAAVLAPDRTEVSPSDPPRHLRRPAPGSRAASRRPAPRNGAARNRRSATRLRAGAVLRALDDRPAEPRP